LPEEVAVTDQVTITNDDEFRSWIAAKPREWAVEIAARVALRVLPLTFATSDTAAKSRLAGQLRLQASRAMFIVRTARMHVDHAQALPAAAYVTAAHAAARAARAADRANVGQAAAIPAANAAAAAAHAAEAARTDAAAAAAGAAADAAAAAAAAANAAGAPAAAIWESITADARWLGSQKGYLMRQPLWLDDVRGNSNFKTNFPLWVREPFDAFDQSQSVIDGPWGVWLAWYRAILPNSRGAMPRSHFGKGKEVEIATKETSFWVRDPDVVTADIADIVAWEWAGRKDQKIESVEPQSDEPTVDDQLGRRPFAQALVERMDKLYEQGGHDGFAAHIHAPWGAGKTSVLMMMRDLMIAKDRKSTNDKPTKQWVVVSFNAWQHERRNPPWWPLMEAVKTECLNSLSRSNAKQAVWLWLRWIWWKIRTDALPYVVLAFVVALSVFLLWYTRGSTGTNPYEWILKIFAAAVTAYAAFFGASRVAIFGSATAAKFYEDISQDPLKRITALFESIIKKIDKPVCVFIDDLDRCRADYVVDLLEGIQTSFRHKNVAYVVAADRGWIKASFEARYGPFFSAVGSIGQPLGYLFLEKIFQISTPIPGMGDKTRSAFWNQLLKATILPQEDGQAAGASSKTQPPLGLTEQFDRAVETKRADLRVKHGENLTREQADAILEESDTEEDRAAVVLELNASGAAAKEAKHLLEEFTGIVPDNPRVMKRMVNAFAMRQAIGILERSATRTEVLARWTILEQRLPALADLLIEHPEWIQMLADEVDDKNREKLPPLLLPFVGSEVVRDIIGKASNHPLSVEHVRTITRGSAN
jgi:hypothetical protein